MTKYGEEERLIVNVQAPVVEVRKVVSAEFMRAVEELAEATNCDRVDGNYQYDPCPTDGRYQDQEQWCPSCNALANYRAAKGVEA